MLVIRLAERNLRVLALTLGLAGAAYSQALVHYGAAATTGAAAGTAAGKKLSDALTNVMNNAAKAAEQGEQKDVETQAAQLEAARAAAAQAAAANREAPPLDGAPARMPASPAPGAAPLARVGTRSTSKGDAAMLASVARSGAEIDVATGRPKRGRRIALAPITEAATAEPVAEPENLAGMPLTMREVLANFHPTLAPFDERLQRVTKGTPREEVRRILGAPASKVTIPGDHDVDEIYYYQERGRNVATVRIEAGIVTRVNTEF